jgi:hypothetical protein
MTLSRRKSSIRHDTTTLPLSSFRPPRRFGVSAPDRGRFFVPHSSLFLAGSVAWPKIRNTGGSSNSLTIDDGDDDFRPATKTTGWTMLSVHDPADHFLCPFGGTNKAHPTLLIETCVVDDPQVEGIPAVVVDRSVAPMGLVGALRTHIGRRATFVVLTRPNLKIILWLSYLCLLVPLDWALIITYPNAAFSWFVSDLWAPRNAGRYGTPAQQPKSVTIYRSSSDRAKTTCWNISF